MSTYFHGWRRNPKTAQQNPFAWGTQSIAETTRGWRRRFGYVTLVMACLFIAGWVRSQRYQDSVHLPTSHVSRGFVSHNGRLMMFSSWFADGRPLFLRSFAWRTKQPPDEIGEPESIWEQLGFAHSRGNAYFGEEIEDWTIPYWLIVFPLTLLSTYLMLGKPPKPTEPPPTP